MPKKSSKKGGNNSGSDISSYITRQTPQRSFSTTGEDGAEQENVAKMAELSPLGNAGASPLASTTVSPDPSLCGDEPSSDNSAVLAAIKVIDSKLGSSVTDIAGRIDAVRHEVKEKLFPNSDKTG